MFKLKYSRPESSTATLATEVLFFISAPQYRVAQTFLQPSTLTLLPLDIQNLRHLPEH